VRNKGSLITWGIILALLIGSAALTVLVPALFGGGTSVPLPRQMSTVTITPPIPIAGQDSFTLASWQAMLVLAFLIPALVIGAGLTLAVIYILISRFVARTQATREYQDSTAAIDRRQKERISRMRETRPTSAAPESTWHRWAAITTTLTVLMFAGFGALLIASFVFPSWQITRQDTIINVVSLTALIAMLVALVVMVLTLRGNRLAAPDRSGVMSIPWDFVAVLITGLLVVGLGIAVIAIVNAPG